MRKPRHQPLTIVTPPAFTLMAPPCKLGEEGQSLWNRLQTEYRIDDAAGCELLAQACLAADRAQELHALIAKDGMTIETKIGMKAHPCLKDELAARAFIVRTLQRLGLNLEVVRPGPGRPSYLGGRG
jgi:Phage terminase, small subunit